MSFVKRTPFLSSIIVMRIYHGLNFPQKRTMKILSCVCYLPPSESTRLNDPELFYSTLLEQVHFYQNEGRIYMCGDFNSRVWDASEFIQGVDDVTLRGVIDHTSNVNGDLSFIFLSTRVCVWLIWPKWLHPCFSLRKICSTVSHFSYAPLFEGPHFLTKMLESNILYDNLFIDI